MAKKKAKKTAKKKAAARKPARPRQKAATRRMATRKASARKTTAKTTVKRTVRKTPRKTASPSAPVAAAPKRPAAPAKRYAKLRKKELARFRELLLAKRAQLVGDVSTLQSQALSKNRQDAAGDLSTMPIHMADLGTDNYEKEFTLGLIEGERALLRDIDEALERIEEGTYGICEATGKPIGKARLRARPWAKFCYEYVLAQERGQQSERL